MTNTLQETALRSDVGQKEALGQYVAFALAPRLH